MIKAIGFLSGMAVMVSAALVLAAPAADDPILQTGTYKAHITAMNCEGCPAMIEETMLAQPGIGSAKVDHKSSTMIFTVKPDALVKVSDLQKALKAASDPVGAGTGFSLKGIRKTGGV